MKRVPYSSEEIEMIVELGQEELPIGNIVKLINDIFHNEKPVRNKRTIKYAISKLSGEENLYKNV